MTDSPIALADAPPDDDAEHRITLEFREAGGQWQHTAMVVLPTCQVIDLALFLSDMDPAAFDGLSNAQQKAVLQDIAALDRPPSTTVN